MLGDASQDIGEPGLRINIVHFGGNDEAVHHRGPLAATIGAAEQPRLPTQSNRPFILPMSGRKWKFITDGIRILAARSAFAVWSNGRPAYS
jgi:hypothetical protein